MKPGTAAPDSVLDLSACMHTPTPQVPNIDGAAEVIKVGPRQLYSLL